MSRIHADPATNGVRFGDVIVTVDPDCADCVLHQVRPGTRDEILRRARFHSIEEIDGARAIQANIARARVDQLADSMASALAFAGKQLTQQRSDRR